MKSTYNNPPILETTTEWIGEWVVSINPRGDGPIKPPMSVVVVRGPTGVRFREYFTDRDEARSKYRDMCNCALMDAVPEFIMP